MIDSLTKETEAVRIKKMQTQLIFFHGIIEGDKSPHVKITAPCLVEKGAKRKEQSGKTSVPCPSVIMSPSLTIRQFHVSTKSILKTKVYFSPNLNN